MLSCSGVGVRGSFPAAAIIESPFMARPFPDFLGVQFNIWTHLVGFLYFFWIFIGAAQGMRACTAGFPIRTLNAVLRAVV
jgi:hypothetical protein